MKIFLTVDVETYTGDYETDVWGKGLGLAYILKQLRVRKKPATFFVETLGATQWGPEPVAKICQALMKAGQDIQLHLHPTVARMEGHASSTDKLYDYDTETQARLIAMGSDILSECGADLPNVFRAGDFAADQRTLAAMRDEGIRIGSNRDLDTKSSIQSRLNDSFPVSNDISMADGMTDVPLSCFRSPFPNLDGQYRHLQVCAVGAGEMRHVLSRMQEAGYACATILMHPQEFFRARAKTCVPVRKNCRRLESLLAFLSSRKDLDVIPMSRCGELDAPTQAPPVIKGSVLWGLVRILEQGIARAKGLS